MSFAECCGEAFRQTYRWSHSAKGEIKMRFTDKWRRLGCCWAW